MAKLIFNDVVKAIMERRSIRKFKPQQISEEQLETILTCGFNAPSGANFQNWFLSVIQDRKLLGELHTEFVKRLPPAEKLPPVMQQRLADPNYDAFFHAPTVILVSYDQEKGSLNCGFLGENMVLAAQSLGLGTCYLGGIIQLLDSAAGKPLLEKMKVPEGYKPCFMLSIGYADENPDPRPRDLTKVARS